MKARCLHPALFLVMHTIESALPFLLPSVFGTAAQPWYNSAAFLLFILVYKVPLLPLTAAFLSLFSYGYFPTAIFLPLLSHRYFLPVLSYRYFPSALSAPLFSYRCSPTAIRCSAVAHAWPSPALHSVLSYILGHLSFSQLAKFRHSI